MVSAAALILAAAFAAHADAAGQAMVNEYGAAVKAFRDRADEYLAQHRHIASQLPPLKNTDDAGELTAREDALGQRIAAARAGIRPGEFIGRDLEPHVREAVKKDWENRPADAREAVGDDLPPASVAKINRPYPSEQPLATFPASLLAALPPLPEGLEYRLAGRHLIVRDVKANLVVDVLANVLPQTPARTGAPHGR